MDLVSLAVPFLFVLALVVGPLVLVWLGPRACLNGRDPADRNRGGEPFRYRENRSKAGLVVSVCVCFDVPPAFRFTLRREGLFDRLAKALRLAREPQVAHEPFDEAFYLDAEDPLAARLLEGTPRLRTRLVAGLPRVTERGASLGSISCSDGRLHLHLRTLGLTRSDAEQSAREAAVWAGPLLEAMRKVAVEPPETAALRRRALEARLAPFVALPLAVLILVVVEMTAPGTVWASRDLLPPALLAGAVALLVHVAWAWRRTFPAQRHRRALEWLFLGWPAFTALSFLLLLALRTGKVLPPPPGEEARGFGPRGNTVVAGGAQAGGGPATGPSSAEKRVAGGRSIPNVAARNGTSSSRRSVRSVSASPSRTV